MLPQIRLGLEQFVNRTQVESVGVPFSQFEQQELQVRHWKPDVLDVFGKAGIADIVHLGITNHRSTGRLVAPLLARSIAQRNGEVSGPIQPEKRIALVLETLTYKG